MGEVMSGVNDYQYVLFRLGDEYYGLNIRDVKTIERVTDITRVPNAADYVEGVINLRGDVVPVINLRKRLLLPQKKSSEESRIMIVSFEDAIVGLLVDSSSEVLQLSKESIEESMDFSLSFDDDYITGIGKDGDRIIILLDLQRVLSIYQPGNEKLYN